MFPRYRPDQSVPESWHFPNVIIVPASYPIRCCPIAEKNGPPGRLLLDQIRCIDKSRLAGKSGEVHAAPLHDVLLKMLS